MESLKSKLQPNPRDNANFLSMLTFWWTIDLFKKGYRKTLELEDLFQPLEVDKSEKLGDRLEKQWFKQQEKPKPSLIKAILSTFWREYAILGFIVVLNDIVIRLMQPMLIGKLLSYFHKGSSVTYENALFYAGCLVFLNGITSVTINHYILGCFQNGMKVRIAVCSVIYRKALRLSTTALGSTAPGKVVNLLSNDVNRFDIVSVFIHSMWIAPLLAIIIGVLLYLEIGLAGLIGMIVIFIVTPIQSYTGKLSSRFRLQTALRTDERVRFMDEVISGIQVIKMYAWEIPFSKLIALARRMELKIVKKNSYVRALYMTFLLFTTRMALFCTMMSMVLLGDKLTASKVFVVAMYFNILSQTLSAMFVRGIAEIAEALVAMGRLQKFLELNEKQGELTKVKTKQLKELAVNGDKTEMEKLIDSDTQLPSNIAVSIKNATANWPTLSSQSPKDKKSNHHIPKPIENEDEYNKEATLQNIDIELRRGILVGVIGNVGAGKSSLLQALLRELPLQSGSISMKGRVSYVSQETWVFAGTVRQNILFGMDMDKTRYDDVVKTCALITDFQQFSDGDRTVIGERGASLSGGQKARISLARAVYRHADIYLMDDPLSAVDAHVGKHLFDTCIGPKGRLGKLKTTRILVTHQIHFLKDADWIIVLNEGKIEAQGTPNSLSESGIDLAKFLEKGEHEEDDNESKSSIKGSEKRIRRYSKSSVKSLSSSISSLAEEVEDEVEEEKKDREAKNQNAEQSSKGTVKGSVVMNYVKCGASPIVLFNILLLFILTQIAASSADLWVAFWTAQEELRDLASKPVAIVDNLTIIEEISVSKIREPILDTTTCMYIHGLLVTSIFIFAIIRSVSMYRAAVNASQNIHDDMFKGCVSAPMRFFDTNPSGRILNRFSKDMGTVDEMLPKAILDASQIILSMFGQIIVTMTVNPMFLIPVALIGIVFMYVRKVYLKTSKNIKRLEGITRSPVFTHLGASLLGLPTIRAFSAQPELIKEFDGHQDLHTASWYMFIASSTSFGFALDLMCVTFVATVTFSFLTFMSQDLMGDQVGLAITQALALTGMLQWGVRQSAEVSNFMMSVERLLEYRDLEPEKQPAKPKAVEKFWPLAGKLQFKNVTYKYFEEAEPVLKNLEFEIMPNEKVGIVGRTGAGKSSLIGALFRLALVDGDIIIDGVNTGDITLENLRSNISIIPQDPVLFSGTLRKNLDPFEDYPDDTLWHALEQVELKDIASGVAAGLQMQVAAGGSNFSVGQRQLICLARAVLRKNKVLVLDEATANVDPNTDQLIQKTIRCQFEQCTVLTIAHRLNTIMDSDRVLVMSAGSVAEFGTPHDLLQLPFGIFKEMVLATGPTESDKMKAIAKETFEMKFNTIKS